MFAAKTLGFLLVICKMEEITAATLEKEKVGPVASPVNKLEEVVLQTTWTVDTSKRGFTSTEKMNIVKIHNSLRSSVSPTAQNMRYMVME